jgi:hypothetical protein
MFDIFKDLRTGTILEAEEILNANGQVNTQDSIQKL